MTRLVEKRRVKGLVSLSIFKIHPSPFTLHPFFSIFLANRAQKYINNVIFALVLSKSLTTINKHLCGKMSLLHERPLSKGVGMSRTELSAECHQPKPQRGDRTCSEFISEWVTDS